VGVCNFVTNHYGSLAMGLKKSRRDNESENGKMKMMDLFEGEGLGAKK
jgi:hypothetical protein